jgi:hypothetical protein
MLIQMNTDNHVDGRDEAMHQFGAELEHSLSAAFPGARDKLVRVLDRRMAKLRPPKGLDPFDRPTPENELTL